MGKTTLTNNVELSVQVMEGSSNIFWNLQVLKPKGTMIIQANSKATYCEYVLILLPDNKKLRRLSADDIQELPAVEIFKDEVTGDYDWREFRGGAENRTWFDALLGRFFSKSEADKGVAGKSGKEEAEARERDAKEKEKEEKEKEEREAEERKEAEEREKEERGEREVEATTSDAEKGATIDVDEETTLMAELQAKLMP